MEWTILFMGPVGAGKSEAVRSLSDIDVVDTDMKATDETAFMKEKTTVSMDVGVVDLGGGDKLRLYGAPGQDRFDFMWEILIEQSRGLALLINHASHDPLADMAHYLKRMAETLGKRKMPVVIGITHADEQPERPLRVYQDYLDRHAIPFASCAPAVLKIDARKRGDVRAMVMALAAMLEMTERFPGRSHVLGLVS